MPVLRTTGIEASRFVTDASAYSPRMFAPAIVAAYLIPDTSNSYSPTVT
jgi:hypothetical protein